MSFIQRIGLSAYTLLRAIFTFLGGLARRIAERFKPAGDAGGSGRYDIVLLGLTAALCLVAVVIVIKTPALAVGALVVMYARGYQDTVQVTDGKVLLTRGTVKEQLAPTDVRKGIELFGLQGYQYGRISFFAVAAGSALAGQIDALAAGETPDDLAPEDAIWNVG